MNDKRDFDRAVDRWLDDGSDATPPRVIDAVLLAARTTPQERDLRISWRTTSMTFLMRVAAVVAVVAVTAMAALYAFGAGPDIGSGPTPQPTLTQSPNPSHAEVTGTQPPTPLDARVIELLSDFLDARVAGEGAQRYLNAPEEDIPLLYATTAGARYERAEFEQILRTEWPYGYVAFTVRLFAGDTVVEQLFFTTPDGRDGLDYQQDGFGTDIAAATEDGRPVAVPYTYFDGDVTVRAAHPWIFHEGWAAGRLIPEGPGVLPTTDGGERNEWDGLLLVPDLRPVGCYMGLPPADAEALAEAIRSDPDLVATAPVAVSVGGTEALMIDAVIATGPGVCDSDGVAGLDGEPGVLVSRDINLEAGDRLRLYLFDAPPGLSMRTLAIAVIAPESRFERAVEAAAPVVDSVEFHAP